MQNQGNMEDRVRNLGNSYGPFSRTLTQDMAEHDSSAWRRVNCDVWQRINSRIAENLQRIFEDLLEIIR